MMRVMIFPIAFMANTFAMMLVMIGLSLFGKPELAADFGLVHGATVALFYSFSGNARSLILAESGEIGVAQILHLRLFMLLPLGACAWLLSVGVVDGGWLFVLLLVVRRATEWLAELFLSEQELHHQRVSALRFVIIQAALSGLLLVALLDGGLLATPMTLIWALSPLLGCAGLALTRRALSRGAPLFAGIRLLLPHFGSTAVIGISVYVFRLFILLLAGKEIAGDLFSAFAMGGILGAVFAQALGPTMVRNERSAEESNAMFNAFSLLLGGVLLLGVLLGLTVWLAPGFLHWTLKSELFWLAVSCSLVGGVVMVLAQRIRLRIIQNPAGGDVFGSDMLANIILLACIPFLFYWLGTQALVALYLVGALFSLAFYATERHGLLGFPALRRLPESRALMLLAVAIMLPLFFQLSGGVFTAEELYLSSNGVLSRLPVPLSVFACYFGILLLGGYSRARLAVLVVFALFIAMLSGSLLVSDLQAEQSSGKLVLMMQYILPVFALVLGQQFGARPLAMPSLARAGVLVLVAIVPLQLLSTWKLGYGYLSPSVFLFSIYQHLLYIPVLILGIFWICAFALEGRRDRLWWLAVFGVFIGSYALLSLSMLALLFLLLGGLGFAFRFVLLGRLSSVLVLWAAMVVGIVLGVFHAADKAMFVHKIAAISMTAEGGMPMSFVERFAAWQFYLGQVFDGWSGLLFGQSAPPDRAIFSSAYSYYLDLTYNFGLLGLFPLLVLIFYTVFSIFRGYREIWRRSDIVGVVGVLLFMVLVDNSLTVGLRQPYSGIFVFFLWGVVLAQLHALRTVSLRI